MENGKEHEEKKNPIKSFRDLEVYQRLYRAMLVVLKEIVPMLPKNEKYDLADQLRRCCKSAPSLVAEGFAKRYQPRAWKKYLEDTIGECNEMCHHLSVCIDAYASYVSVEVCKELINEYDIASKQCHRLKESWINFHEKD